MALLPAFKPPTALGTAAPSLVPSCPNRVLVLLCLHSPLRAGGRGCGARGTDGGRPVLRLLLLTSAAADPGGPRLRARVLISDHLNPRALPSLSAPRSVEPHRPLLWRPARLARQIDARWKRSLAGPRPAFRDPAEIRNSPVHGAYWLQCPRCGGDRGPGGRLGARVCRWSRTGRRQAGAPVDSDKLIAAGDAAGRRLAACAIWYPGVSAPTVIRGRC